MDLATSPRGIAEIEHHEGVVLRAYRDPVGVLTIGAGLTNASGVVRIVSSCVRVLPSTTSSSRRAAFSNGRKPNTRNASAP